MKDKMFLTILCVLFLLFGSVASAAAASAYPSKVITVVCTHAAGGSTDKPLRLFAPFVEKYLGKGISLVIENMEGAGGGIARAHVYKQRPDGTILLFSQQPSLSISALIRDKAGFDPLKFVPIYNVSGGNYQGIAVAYDSPYKNLKEMVEASKTKPMTMAGSGIGAISHLNCLQLNKLGAKFTYMPFNSSAEGMMAAAGGSADMVNTNYTMVEPMEKSKKLRLITTLGPARGEYAPNVPTGLELGIPIAMDQLGGFFGPPGMPKDRVDILVAAMEKAGKDPEFIKTAKQANEVIKPMGPDQFAKELLEIHKIVLDILPELKEAGTKK